LEASSKQAKAFSEKLAQDIWEMGGARKTRTSSKHMAATGAFFADLLKVAGEDPDRFSYRPMMASSFTGERIGYRSLKQVVDGALAAKLIEVREGSGGGNLVGQATRFKATPTLLLLAKAFGIEPSEWQEHFRSIPRPAEIAEPLVLKSCSTFVRGRKRDGVRMPFDASNPKAIQLAWQVDEINAFFAGVLIEPDSDHYGFHRIFNQGDQPGFAWDKGGRLYSMGDSYQNRKAAHRSRMRLNGEPVVEIDIRASHLTILHARLGEPFDPSAQDPYWHPDIPRHVMKGWMVMTLGHDKFHRAWSSDMTRDYRAKTGGRLGKDHPIRLVREKALESIPILYGWQSCPLRWGDLQYIESCAVVDTVHQLAIENSIPALPVHDSIIVPDSKKAIAASVLRANFEKHVGVEPMLTFK
jgi:hypothetical protein